MNSKVRGISLLASLSLVFGVLVVAVSVRDMSMAKADEGLGRVEKHPSRPLDFALVHDLPDGIEPGSWIYPVKTLGEWVWVWSADKEDVAAERLLWLSNERLRTGYELIAEGEQTEGVATLRKAEGYLVKAGTAAAELRDDALERTVDTHEKVLHELEQVVDDSLRPRVTELKNVPAGMK